MDLQAMDNKIYTMLNDRYGDSYYTYMQETDSGYSFMEPQFRELLFDCTKRDGAIERLCVRYYPKGDYVEVRLVG